MKRNVITTFLLIIVCFIVLYPSNSLALIDYSKTRNTQYSSLIVGREVVEKRTENSKTTYLGKVFGKDKFSVDVFSGAVHYKDNYSNGVESWKDIDLTPVNGIVDKTPYILQIDGAKVTILDKKTRSITVIELTDIGNKKVTKPLTSMIKGKSSVKDIDIDTDLEIAWENTRIKVTRILRSAKASKDAKFSISQVGNGIKLTSKAEDANFKSVPVISFIKDGVLSENIDSNEILNYPIRIDPTLDISVGANLDDVMVIPSSSQLLDYSIMVLGKTNADWEIGMRFLGITIPDGATVTTSYIVFTSSNNDSADTVRTKLSAEQNNSANTFSTYANYAGRTLTTNQVEWNFTTDWVNGLTYNSTEIKSVVQELVNDYTGLSSANIAFFVKNNGSDTNASRNTWSYNGSTVNCPKLHIEYTTFSAPIVTTQSVSSIEEATATGNGNITDTGGDAIIAWGVCVCLASHSNLPDIGDSVFSGSGIGGVGAFTANITGLIESTSYYARAYATSSQVTVYGNSVQFTSLGGYSPYMQATVVALDVNNDGLLGAPETTTMTNALDSLFGEGNYNRQMDTDYDGDVDSTDQSYLNDRISSGVTLATIRSNIKLNYQQLEWADGWKCVLWSLAPVSVPVFIGIETNINFEGTPINVTKGWINVISHPYINLTPHYDVYPYVYSAYICNEYTFDTFIASYKLLGYGCFAYGESTGHAYPIFFTGGDWQDLHNWVVVSTYEGILWRADACDANYQTTAIRFFSDTFDRTSGDYYYPNNSNCHKLTVNYGAKTVGYSTNYANYLTYFSTEEPLPINYMYNSELDYTKPYSLSFILGN